MRIEYTLRAEDYLNYNIFHLKHNKESRRSFLFNRFVLPSIFLFFALFFDGPPILVRVVLGIIAMILWASFYGIVTKNRLKRQVTKILKDNEDKGFVGRRVLEINENSIKIITSSGENIINIDTIHEVVETNDYLYIYVNSMSAIVIPKLFFKDDDVNEIKEIIKK